MIFVFGPLWFVLAAVILFWPGLPPLTTVWLSAARTGSSRRPRPPVRALPAS